MKSKFFVIEVVLDGDEEVFIIRNKQGVILKACTSRDSCMEFLCEPVVEVELGAGVQAPIKD